MTKMTKNVGRASVDLASLRPFVVQPLRLKLSSGGHITLQMQYRPFASFDAGWELPPTVALGTHEDDG
jgi:hypothetical protein